jgi:hypothetical protein
MQLSSWDGDAVTLSLSQEKKNHTGRSNRRATVRYRCAPATPGKVYVTDDQEFQRAWVLDLSATGVGLETVRQLEAGAFLIINLKGRTKEYQLPAHVVHATRQPRGEWLVGCELINPIANEDLDDLLD